MWSHAEFFLTYPSASSLLRNGLAGQRLMRELCNASFLTNLQDDHAALLCTLFQSRWIPANTVVFQEGEHSSECSSLFMLVSGSAVMYQAAPGGGQSKHDNRRRSPINAIALADPRHLVCHVWFCAGQNLVKAIEPGAFFGEACT